MYKTIGKMSKNLKISSYKSVYVTFAVCCSYENDFGTPTMNDILRRYVKS